jgi:hypothetical protein
MRFAHGTLGSLAQQGQRRCVVRPAGDQPAEPGVAVDLKQTVSPASRAGVQILGLVRYVLSMFIPINLKNLHLCTWVPVHERESDGWERKPRSARLIIAPSAMTKLIAVSVESLAG